MRDITRGSYGWWVVRIPIAERHQEMEMDILKYVLFGMESRSRSRRRIEQNRIDRFRTTIDKDKDQFGFQIN